MASLRKRVRPSSSAAEEAQDGRDNPRDLSVLLTCRPLLAYAGCAMLFHLAIAPLLPLVGQKLALAHPAWGTAPISSCAIAAQAILRPIALIVGHTADSWGRKPLLLIGFGILPAVRAALRAADAGNRPAGSCPFPDGRHK